MGLYKIHDISSGLGMMACCSKPPVPGILSLGAAVVVQCCFHGNHGNSSSALSCTSNYFLRLVPNSNSCCLNLVTFLAQSISSFGKLEKLLLYVGKLRCRKSN